MHWNWTFARKQADATSGEWATVSTACVQRQGLPIAETTPDFTEFRGSCGHEDLFISPTK